MDCHFLRSFCFISVSDHGERLRILGSYGQYLGEHMPSLFFVWNFKGGLVQEDVTTFLKTKDT